MTVSYLQTWEDGKRGKYRRFETMNNVRNSYKSMKGAMSNKHRWGRSFSLHPTKNIEGKDDRPT